MTLNLRPAIQTNNEMNYIKSTLSATMLYNRIVLIVLKYLFFIL